MRDILEDAHHSVSKRMLLMSVGTKVLIIKKGRAFIKLDVVSAVSLKYPTVPLSTGVFAIINAKTFLKYLQFHLTEKQFRTLFFVDLIVVVFVLVVGLTYFGHIGFWKGRFYLLYDKEYVLYCHCVYVSATVASSKHILFLCTSALWFTCSSPPFLLFLFLSFLLL